MNRRRDKRAGCNQLGLTVELNTAVNFDLSQHRDVCLRGCSPSIFDANKHQGGGREDKSICRTPQPFEPLTRTTSHRAETGMVLLTIYIRAPTGAPGAKCNLFSSGDGLFFTFFRMSPHSALVLRSVSSLKLLHKRGRR